MKRILALFLLAGLLVAGSTAFAEDQTQPAPPAPVVATTQAPAAPLKIDTGDTAWMIVATELVVLMTSPGRALFYGGL